MSVSIYRGGTTGGTDGTLEVPSDSQGIALISIGTTATFHMRCPSGFRSSEQVTVNAPAECSVSADGITYGATAVYASGSIGDTNVACFVKRISGTSMSVSGLITTPRLILIATTTIAPVISGTLSAIAGASSATLSGVSATGTITKWQYTKDGGTNWVDVASTASVFPSTIVTGLTPFTPVTFGVRAMSVAAPSATLSGTCTPFYLNDFGAGQALDTTNLAAYQAGTGTSAVTAGQWKFTSTVATDASGGVYRTPVSKTATRTFRVKFVCPSPTSSGVPQENAIGLRASATQPAAIVSASDDAKLFLELVGQSTTAVFVYGQYLDTSGWKYSVGGAWSATQVSYALTTGGVYFADIEVDPNAGTPRWRLAVLNASEVALFTTPWVNFSAVQGDATNTYWVDSGDRFSDIRYGTLALSQFKVMG